MKTRCRLWCWRRCSFGRRACTRSPRRRWRLQHAWNERSRRTRRRRGIRIKRSGTATYGRRQSGSLVWCELRPSRSWRELRRSGSCRWPSRRAFRRSRSCGWWRRVRRRTATFRRAGKWVPPAMRRLRRARRAPSFWRAVPSVTTTASLPPPAAAFLNPNPLTTNVRPLPSIHRNRREQEGVLLAVGSDSFANDEAGIADRLCDRKDGEVARGKIAKRVEIKHLAVGVEERVLGVVARCRGSDNHSGCVVTLSDDAVGRARSSTERSQICDAVA